MVAANFRRTHSPSDWLGLRDDGHLALSLHSSDELHLLLLLLLLLLSAATKDDSLCIAVHSH